MDHPKGAGWAGLRHDKPAALPQPTTGTIIISSYMLCHWLLYSGEVSFLALWNVQAKSAASKKHDEFAGRLKYGNKAELYKTTQQPR